MENKTFQEEFEEILKPYINKKHDKAYTFIIFGEESFKKFQKAMDDYYKQNKNGK